MCVRWLGMRLGSVRLSIPAFIGHLGAPFVPQGRPLLVPTPCREVGVIVDALVAGGAPVTTGEGRTLGLSRERSLIASGPFDQSVTETGVVTRRDPFVQTRVPKRNRETGIQGRPFLRFRPRSPPFPEGLLGRCRSAWSGPEVDSCCLGGKGREVSD